MKKKWNCSSKQLAHPNQEVICVSMTSWSTSLKLKYSVVIPVVWTLEWFRYNLLLYSSQYMNGGIEKYLALDDWDERNECYWNSLCRRRVRTMSVDEWMNKIFCFWILGKYQYVSTVLSKNEWMNFSGDEFCWFEISIFWNFIFDK